MLTKQVAPERYAEIDPKVTQTRWTREQKTEDLKAVLDLVIREIDPVTTVPIPHRHERKGGGHEWHFLKSQRQAVK